jgi:hypothetical protein
MLDLFVLSFGFKRFFAAVSSSSKLLAATLCLWTK